MAKFRLIVLTLLVFTVCVGCDMRIFKDYGFSRVRAEIPHGKISLRMDGTTVKVDNQTITAAPYLMVLVLRLQEDVYFDECSVILHNVMLRNKENGNELLISNRVSESFTSSNEEDMRALFYFKNVEIPFANHELSFQYSLLKDCGLGTDMINVVLPLEKQYSEEEVSFWDFLRNQ